MLVPIDDMRAHTAANPSFSVAAEALARLVGPWGATAIAVIVVLSTLGSTHASIMTGARVSFAQARDRLLFRFVGHVDRSWNTPDVSLFLQLALSIAAVWCLGSFKSLADGFVFTMWIFHALAGAAVFVLRAKRPNATRPFRCPGYPIVPALFVLAALGMTGMSIYADGDKVPVPFFPSLGERPYIHTLPWLVVLAAGVPIYFIWRRFWPESGSADEAVP
jgi:amino acid transporter